MRTAKKYSLKHPDLFKEKLLKWSQQFSNVVWLDSNAENKNDKEKYRSYDAILAVDAYTSVLSDYKNAFKTLKEYQSTTHDWIFGYLTYDLKNDIEDLKSANFDGLQFPELFFFQPKKLFLFTGKILEIKYLNSIADELEYDFNAIQKSNGLIIQESNEPIKIKLRIEKEEYFEKIDTILKHIHRGDIYEVNFCQEFYAEKVYIHPLQTYFKLNTISKTPFAVFFRCGDNYLLSASPERYLKKEKDKIISQPIKGTAKRSENIKEDLLLKQNLFLSEKERSENIMIVDLVRNDLAKTAINGSVKVEELCKIISYKQVHQMISTVVSTVDDVHPVDILKTTFPMGSMTGAPKISAMQIIEVLEETKRGLYSGAVGYFEPNGNFDFNVVIRSILYNKTKQYVSYSVGGAITAKSDPLKEYEECLIKAKAMREVLEN